MDFYAILDQVIDVLRQRQRVTYRALKRQFDLDDDYLEDLKAELIQGQQLAVDEAGAMLVWTGDRASGPFPTGEPASSAHPARGEAIALQVSTPPQHGTSRPPSSPVLAGERRQVTVLFADISGFTALADTMDPEEVRQVMNACFAQLVPVVEAYGGTIDKFIGDEIMALFGAPIAHDNDAERAVRTALALVEALAAFNTAQGTTLGLHCGINTGLVIAGGIGTPSRQDYSVMGDAVNLAARLEDASEWGQIFVGLETYRLTRTLFRYASLAPLAVKGKSDPVQVYQVLGVCEASERYGLAAPTPLPLVGRTAELALLLDRWEHATQGLGHGVVLSGEAGIGKSRLAAALGERVEQEGALWITIRCSPYHTNSALYPILTRLERALQGPDEEPAAAKVERLEGLLRPTGLPLAHVVSLIAALLLLPLPEGRYTPLRLSPQQQRSQTLEVLVTWLLAEAARQPVLSVWEDLHWADASTLELLDLLLRQVPTARMLVVGTCRPPFQPPWGVRSYLTPLMLSRLGQPQIEQMVAHVTAGKALPPEVLRQIMVQTDGVPLFVEECVKMVLGAPLVREEDAQYVLTGPLPPLAIPPTLQGILMARLDHLTSGKVVAQLGATVGKEFAYGLLAAVSPLDEPMVQHGLAELVEAELLYQRGHLPQAQFIFKHALIQETAYQSLLKSTRQQYHQRIAQVLEAQFPEMCETQPELLARHYTKAGFREQAVGYWQRAGQQALQRSANVEAVQHLTTGLELLAMLPETPARAQQELDLQLALGPALIATKGHAVPEVEQTYARARALGAQIGETSQRFLTLRGLCWFYRSRGALPTARELGEQLVELAQRTATPTLLLEAHEALGNTLFFLGDYAGARTHLEQGIAVMDAAAQRGLALSHGWAPGVGCLALVAGALWCLGYPTQAVRWSQEALALAQTLAHPYSLALAQFSAAVLHHRRREVAAVQAQAEALLPLATAQGYPLFVGLGTYWYGWMLAVRGQGEAGRAQMHQGLAAAVATGFTLVGPLCLVPLAEALGHAGQVAEGLRLLAEVLTASEASGQSDVLAEAYRLQGELLLRQAVPEAAHAETCLHQALAIARRQQAKSWELRAATSLARLWQQQGKRAAARELLTEVYSWFTESFDTADLQEAKALLEALA